MELKKNGVLFIIFSLGNGGTERMMMNVLNKCELGKFNKILYLYNNLNMNSYEDLLTDKVTKYKTKNTKNPFRHIIRIVKLMKIIKKENVKTIVCFSSQATLMAVIVKKLFIFRKFNVITRLGAIFLEQYSDSIKNRLKYYFWINMTLNFSYRYSDKIICLTSAMKNDLVKNSSILKDKIVVINNYIDKAKIEYLIHNSSPVEIKNYIISVGRLEKQKNFKGLIRAFNLVKDKINVDLIILGEGSQRSEIEDLIVQLKCTKRIKLLGFKKNPYKYIFNSSFFILNSYFEGMSNSLLEVLVCKTPIIVTDHPGVEDVITNNENGIVVPIGDEKKLANAILTLSKDKELRTRLAESGLKSLKKFTESMKRYNHLINEISE